MSVDHVRYCPWEDERLPVEHDCVGSTGPCPNEQGNTCGICPRDLAAQEATRYGSPSDLDTPHEREAP